MYGLSYSFLNIVDSFFADFMGAFNFVKHH